MFVDWEKQMRFEGSLAAWNAERGHGEIAPEQGGQTLFVHVSAFPHDGPPPALGEPLSFEVVSGSDGRKQAARVLRSRRRAAADPAQRLLSPPLRRPWRELKRERRRRIGLALAGLIVAVAALGWIELSKPGGWRAGPAVDASARR